MYHIRSTILNIYNVSHIAHQYYFQKYNTRITKKSRTSVTSPGFSYMNFEFYNQGIYE
jgi:hypothetical protein